MKRHPSASIEQGLILAGKISIECHEQIKSRSMTDRENPSIKRKHTYYINSELRRRDASGEVPLYPGLFAP